MTKDEALDLALEALEKSLPRLAPYGEQDWLDSRAAITAIKQARAAPVHKPYRPLQDNGSQYFGGSWDTLPTQSAPVQEPEWKQIAEDLRFHGLTLVKTATGYAVLKLGAVINGKLPPTKFVAKETK